MKALGEHISVASSSRLILYLAGAFVLIHGLLLAAGIRFDTAPLNRSWQFLDPELLRGELLKSCYYLHSQPPLFNMFLGGVLKVSSGEGTPVFHAVYVAAGLLLYLAVFFLQVRLGVRRPVALILSTLFIASPAFVAYEHWLFYTFPVAVVLASSAWLLIRFLDSGANWAVFTFFALILLLCGARSMFHLSYFVAVALWLLVAVREKRRIVLLAALVPLVLLVSVYTKNLVLFGEFTTSTWTGMNVWGTTGRNVPSEERRRLVHQGVISELSLMDRYSPLAEYPERYTNVSGFEDIAALRQVKKSTGHHNLNHLAYVAISRQYLRDSLYVTRHYPKAILVGFSRAWFQYFKSSSDAAFASGTRHRLAFLSNLYDYAFYGKLPLNLSRVAKLPIYDRKVRHYAYLFLLVGLPLVFVHGLRLALHGGRDTECLTRSQRMLLLYLCFNIAYVAFIGNAVEMGENNRFRFVTDPLYIVLLGLAIEHLLARRPRRSGMRGSRNC